MAKANDFIKQIALSELLQYHKLNTSQCCMLCSFVGEILSTTEWQEMKFCDDSTLELIKHLCTRLNIGISVCEEWRQRRRGNLDGK